jgi:hypothetical protein
MGRSLESLSARINTYVVWRVRIEHLHAVYVDHPRGEFCVSGLFADASCHRSS